MIVSVCSDKGAPGVTTLATALGLVWPGERAVVEADTAGSDLSFRLRQNVSEFAPPHLAPDPSIAGLATAARLGLTAAGPLPFAQDTTLGVPVVPGVLSAERFRALRSLWPGLAPALARWRGTVLADLGRLHQGAPTVPVAQASTAVLLVTRADLEGLFHVRDRVAELAGMVGPGSARRVRCSSGWRSARWTLGSAPRTPSSRPSAWPSSCTRWASRPGPRSSAGCAVSCR